MNGEPLSPQPEIKSPEPVYDESLNNLTALQYIRLLTYVDKQKFRGMDGFRRYNNQRIQSIATDTELCSTVY